jgi:hypothetical protein
MVCPTMVGNSASGLNCSANLNDVWITNAEISSNSLAGMAFANCSDIQIISPFMESSVAFANLQFVSCSLVSITGGFSQAAQDAAAGNGVQVSSCAGVSIVGMSISSNNLYGIYVGASSTGVVLSGNVIDDLAATGFTHTAAIGIATASPVTIMGNDLAGVSGGAVSGSLPAGSCVVGNRGYAATALSNAWTSSGDTAVNGYITIIDSGGTARKIATIA